MEQEAEEHKLVLESLEPVEPGRKCFRLVNGVLVERSVGEVVPAVRTNAEGLKGVLEGLLKEYKRKQEEMERWKVCFFCFILFPCFCDWEEGLANGWVWGSIIG